MYVLIDIEWIQRGTETSITQLAAERVTENWTVTADFQRLVRPVNPQDTDWTHIAYSGYPQDAFEAGVGEAECIQDFLSFLDAGDTVFCWHSDQKRLLTKKCRLYTGAPAPNKIKCLNNKALALAEEKGFASLGLYSLASEAGIAVPTPMHKSVNDVSVLRSLLYALGYQQNNPPGKAQNPKMQAVNRQERNTGILSRVSYQYIFTPESQIFHRKSCRLILNANVINGCTYYQTAVKKRRPCKVCRPKPEETAASAKQAKDSAVPKAGNLNPNGQTESSPALQPEKQATPEQTESNQAVPGQPKAITAPQPPEKKIVMAKLLGDQWIEITNTKLVGYCHNAIHPGKLTRKIMEAHNCIGKNCSYFEKYANSGFWIEQENKKRRKAEQKAAQQLQKDATRKQKEELENLKILLQSYADNTEHKLQIIRIEKEPQDRYKLFYVSKYPFADGNRFPDFLQTVKASFPRYRIQLRHIRDVDGHFITTDEYAVIRKQRK